MEGGHAVFMSLHCTTFFEITTLTALWRKGRCRRICFLLWCGTAGGMRRIRVYHSLSKVFSIWLRFRHNVGRGIAHADSSDDNRLECWSVFQGIRRR